MKKGLVLMLTRWMAIAGGLAIVLLVGETAVFAQSEQEICHEKCASAHSYYEDALIAHDPLGGLVCSCISEGGEVIGLYRYQAGAWIGMAKPGTESKPPPKRDEPTPPPKVVVKVTAPPRPVVEEPPPRPETPRREPPRKKKHRDGPGFEFLVAFGVNSCISSGDEKCADIVPNVQFMLSPGVRLAKFVGIFLDFDYGWLTASFQDNSDSSMNTLTLTFVPRFGFDFDVGELYGGMGMGYGRLSKTYSDSSSYVWHGFVPKLNLGILFRVGGPAMLGVNLDYVLTPNGTGTVCFDPLEGSTECESNNSDVENLLQVSVLLKLAF